MWQSCSCCNSGIIYCIRIKCKIGAQDISLSLWYCWLMAYVAHGYLSKKCATYHLFSTLTQRTMWCSLLMQNSNGICKTNRINWNNTISLATSCPWNFLHLHLHLFLVFVIVYVFFFIFLLLLWNFFDLIVFSEWNK